MSRRTYWLGRGAVALAMAWGTFGASGCGSFSYLTNRRSIEEQIENDPNYSIANVQGPTERKLRAAQWSRDRENLAGDEGLSAAYKRYEAAVELYDQGRYSEAEKLFASIAKERRDTYESFYAKWNRFWGVTPKSSYDPYSNFGDPVEEDAMYMLGQAQFAQRRYAEAQDSYDALLNKYPSSRHLDAVTRQLFRIARYWLGFPDNVGNSGDAGIQMASAEVEIPGKPPERKPSSLDSVPVLPNFTDKSRPMFDTFGRGEQALRSIWLHDATGPLADDALMLAANHNLRQENFIEAARLYSLLRDQYPDSPHLKDAYLLGSHVTLASYEGPSYDSKALEDALSLKRTMLQVFPDITDEERARLEQEVNTLQNAEIARYWDLIEFYQAKNYEPSVALHCHLLINKFPDSEYAERARRVLAEMEAQKQGGGSFWSFGRPQRRPNASDPTRVAEANPFENSEPSEPPQPPTTRSDITLPSNPGPGNQTEAPTPRKSSLFGNLNNMLRRPSQPPQLQPAGDPQEESSGTTPGRVTLE
ncbi:MAG: tetratricopeptide repeat protein [Planctomycetaceae bacterium]|nr:tetratricopeptide repeat protein [Planctomycetaceae bacterium]